MSTEDRDRLALLEAVVAAREALVVSWVARDEQTGDDIAPAHAVGELRAAASEPPLLKPLLRRDEALRVASAGGDGHALLAAMAFPLARAEARARTLGDTERARWATSALPLAELDRELAPTDERRVLLSLPAVPPRPPATTTGPVRVSLDEIRRFLDCAVQAAARRIVRDDDDDDARTRESEPFELDARAHSDLVRALVLGPLTGGATTVDTLAARRVAHGQFPLGAFGARARALAEDDAREVLHQLRAARPGARDLAPVRFGAGREHGDAARRALDPIALDRLPDGRTLELVGTTAPLLPGTLEPVLLDFGRARSREQRHAEDLRLAVRGFVDHAALVLGGEAPGRRQGLVVSRTRRLDLAYKPLRADLARRWLASLGKELLAPQTSFMPIESVMRVAHLFTTGSSTLERDLQRSIEVVRGPKWEGGRSRWGPVRDAVRLPPPASPARIAGQRFAIFFAHLEAPSTQLPPKRGAR